MLKLPPSTKMNKHLPKKAIYAKFDMRTAARERFDTDISKISIVNEVSSLTTNISKGENIDSFFVLLVLLKHDNYDDKNIVLLSKLIEQRMIFVLQCHNKARIGVFHNKLYQTSWMPIDELEIELRGMNFDTVWENIVVQLGDVHIEQGNSLEEQLAIDKHRQNIERRITSLERQARAEKQPRRKFELVQEINKLKGLYI